VQIVNRTVQIARGVLSPAAGSGEQGPPASGATITIYDSTANNNGLQGNPTIPFSRLVLSINSSADGGASGLTFEGSTDNGATWDTMQTAASYTTASGNQIYDIAVLMPQVRIKYVNSAATLTRWRMSLEGVIGDRTKTT
jgi:hypothetical protein